MHNAPKVARVNARGCGYRACWGPLVPKRYRPVPASAIAHALLEAALQAVPGEHIIESDALHG